MHYPFTLEGIMTLKQYLLSIALLLVVSVVKGQSTSDDFFPLAVGDQWTYKYHTHIYTPWDMITDEDGVASYTILSKSSANDSTLWIFQETRDVIQDVYSFFPPANHDTTAIKDTTIFQIVENNNGNHKLVRIGQISNFWNSVFPFAPDSTDSLCFYRYYRGTSPDSISILKIYPDPLSYFINASFKRSIGLSNISYSHSDMLSGSYNTNHILQSSLLTSVDAHNSSSLPQDFVLDQNYPNPFNPQTVIPFQTYKEAKVLIRIYDVLGRMVSTIYDGSIQAGNHTFRWIASGQSSGIYLCVVNVNGVSKAIRFVLLK
jgi:hypothetical protein